MFTAIERIGARMITPSFSRRECLNAMTATALWTGFVRRTEGVLLAQEPADGQSTAAQSIPADGAGAFRGARPRAAGRPARSPVPGSKRKPTQKPTLPRCAARFSSKLCSVSRKTPLAPAITGVVERDAYKIEKVIFESRPEFLVTANLYVPKNRKFPLPGVVGSCGHSENGKAAEPYQSFAQGPARAHGLRRSHFRSHRPGRAIAVRSPETRKS